MKPNKGPFTRLKNYISTLDRFPVTFQFRVGNKNKYGTFIGGSWYVIFLILSLLYMFKKTFEFFNWTNYKLTFIEKALYPSPKMNWGNMDFNYAFQILFENNTSIQYSKYKDLFIVETILKEKKQNSFSEKNLQQRPCISQDFRDSNEDPLFEKTSFSELSCIENVNDISLFGTHHDEEISYIQNKIKINEKYLTNKNSLDEIFKNNIFKFKVYYIDVLNDVSSLEDPIVQRIDSMYTYLDVRFLKKIKIDFQEFIYREDKNLFFHHFIEKNFLKKFSSQESDVTIVDRVNSVLIQKKDFLKINIMAHNNVKIVTKSFQNLLEFLGAVSSQLSNILIWSSIIMNAYNQVQAKQYIMSKIMKYNDVVSPKTKESISYFTSKFNTQLIEEVKEKNPILFLFKKGMFNSEQKNAGIANSNEKKNNIEPESINKQHSDIVSFDPNNFEKKVNLEHEKNKNKDKFIELVRKKETTDNSILKSQKERLNESVNEEPENQEELIMKRNPHSMGLFDILLYVFCCKSKEKKEMVFEKADKIFNKNLDIISFMKKMQELDIVKYLVMDNDTIELMNFLSKPSVTIGKKTITDQEYLKFFFPNDKVNSINFSNIDQLKNSYDNILKRSSYSKTDKRILNLFHIQLQEMKM